MTLRTRTQVSTKTNKSGDRIRLNGGASDEGTSGLATSIATMVLVSPLGFLVHGTSAQLPVGTVVQASLGEQLVFQQQPSPAIAGVAPDEARPLPARFDPTWFTGQGEQASGR